MGEPFLAWVLRHLASQGLGQAIVSVGHLSEVIENYLARWPCDQLVVTSVREHAPLGTGGGARLAAQAARDAERLVVVNGDSLVLADWQGAWQLLEGDDTDGVILGVEVDDAARYGTLELGNDGRLVGFREKQTGHPSKAGSLSRAGDLINAGVYFFKRPLLDALPAETPLSLENDLFPAWLAGGANFRVLSVRGPFLDIGTPESVRQAEAFIQGHLGNQLRAA
jgi:D-glycero-alpha-D-manno-heptose 1-phosphate guanylyltransferase